MGAAYTSTSVDSGAETVDCFVLNVVWTPNRENIWICNLPTTKLRILFLLGFPHVVGFFGCVFSIITVVVLMRV